MIMLAFLLLILSTGLCTVLSRRVPTRILGIFAAGTLVIVALMLIGNTLGWSTIATPSLVWAKLNGITVRITFHLSGESYALMLVLLGGGTLALGTLALALDPTIYGFGTLFSWVLMAIAAVFLALMSSGMLFIFAWALTVVSCYSAIRTSGVLSQYHDTPLGVGVGLLSSLFLLGGIVATQSALASGKPPSATAIICFLLACLMLVGCVPFHNAFDEVTKAPAALSGLFYGGILPVFALGSLLRFVREPASLLGMPLVGFSSSSSSFLIIIGVISTVACAAGALREHQLRHLLAWHVSSQAGAIVVAAGIQTPLSLMAGSALLLNLVLTTLAGMLAIAIFEHETGHDDFTKDLSPAGNHRLFRTAGFVWAIAALSAIGLPPCWGFFGRYWLFQSASSKVPWTIPLMLAANSMAALSYLVPLARFWWYDRTLTKQGAISSQPSRAKTQAAVGVTQKLDGKHQQGYGFLAITVGALIILFGIAPQLVWNGWLKTLPNVPSTLPLSNVIISGNIVFVICGAVLSLVIWRIDWSRKTISDEDMIPVILPPDTLAHSLLPLSWLAQPTSLITSLWHGLLLLNKGVHFLLSVFEERYYLAGVLMAIISLIVVMAQL